MGDVADAPGTSVVLPPLPPAPPKPSGSKKPEKPKKSVQPAEHPKYRDMIATAIGSLKERGGSSRQAILKYILANFSVGNEVSKVNARVKMALRAGIKVGSLKQAKGTGASGSFRLGEKKQSAKPKIAKKPKTAAAKKPGLKKPKTVAKKKMPTPKKTSGVKKTKSAAAASAKRQKKSAVKKTAVKKPKGNKSPAKKVAKPKKIIKKMPAKKALKTKAPKI